MTDRDLVEAAPSVAVLETERLVLRRLEAGDAAFILELLNEPSFLRFIGDKGVRTLDDARTYIANGPGASYARFGFGLYLTLLKEGGAPIGICGILKRETLADVDVGYAFAPRYWKQGYARESVAAVLEHAHRDFGLARIVAIVSPDNDDSIRLLERLGFRSEGLVRLSEGAEEVVLLSREMA
jgi:RimJ/RimL family protein N-acetyltransferase